MIEITKMSELTPYFEGAASKIIDAVWPDQNDMFLSCLAVHQAAPHIANAFYVVATDSETQEAVGFCLSEDSNLSSELRTISWLVVNPKDQKKGIGGQLIDVCVKDAKQRHKDILIGTVVPDFFAKLGFQTIGDYSANRRVLMQYKV